MNDPDRSLSDIKQAALHQVDTLTPELIALSQRLFDHPETAYKEVNACRWLSEFLGSKGFTVKTGIGGVINIEPRPFVETHHQVKIFTRQ